MKRLDVSEIAAVCAFILGIEKPVKIKVYSRHIPDAYYCVAVHYMRQHMGEWFHQIDVSRDWCFDNGRNHGPNEIVAHEMVHAYVAENHPRAHTHGRTFQRKAAALRRNLRTLGYTLGVLYHPEIDE